MLVVQLRQEGVATPPVHRVPGLGDRQGLWLEAPEGAVDQVVVGGEDCRGCVGVPEGT